MNRNQAIARIIIMIVMSLSIYGCSGLSGGNDPASTQEATLELQDTTVSALGEVVPERWANLSFASGGYDLDVRVNVGETVKKGDILASVKNLPQQAAVSNARSVLSSAEANLDRLKDLEAPDRDISVAQKAVYAAQANLDQALESLDETQIKAPFLGEIIDIFLRDFETAPPGQPVILLADLSTLVIQTTDLGEVDVARVRVEDPVKIVFDALPDITISGSVKRIALHPGVGAGTYYTVTIGMDEIPENLRWGMSAFVEIKTNPNAPLSASIFFASPTQTTPHKNPTMGNTSTKTSTATQTMNPNAPPRSTSTWTSSPIPQLITIWTSTSTSSMQPTYTFSPTLTPTKSIQPTVTMTPTPFHLVTPRPTATG
jgi:RND family efflux transporter MFP subunit